MSRPAVTPELLARFRAYNAIHLAWGNLHIVLDDMNLADSHVEFCINRAACDGDTEGLDLAKILRSLTRTQRGRIAKEGRYRG